MKAFRRVLPLVVGAALLASSAGCDWPEDTRFVHKVFDEVEITSDVVYRSTTDYLGNPIDLKLDIYQPVGDTRSERPVVMWMHGGGWTFGDKTHLAAYAQDSAERGYVGVSIQYRLRDQGNVDAIFDAWEDAVAAVQWLKDNAAQYRIDPDAVIAGGHSAGAVNALHLLYLSDPSPIAGAVVMSGFTPIAATAGDPPVVMHQGTTDDIITHAQATSTCNKTTEVGNHCTLFSYEGDHYIPYVEPHQALIKDRTGDWIFEQILWPLGYRAESPGDDARSAA